MSYHYLKFKPRKIYRRNGIAAYYDISRKILVPATPEETVRQGFVRYLTEKLRYPTEHIETEISLSHFKKGVRDRADILGRFPPNKTKKGLPLFLVECKAPGIVLTDDALDQCIRYDRHIKTPGHIFITNGVDTCFYFKRGRSYEPAKSLPSYKLLLKEERFRNAPRIKSFKYPPPPFSQRTGREILRWATSNEVGWIGEGSPKGHLGYLMNLNGLIQSDYDRPKLPLTLRYGKILESGFRYTQFGNAAGGSWPGRYRFFIMQDKRGNHQIISLSIMGMLYGNTDPRFPGNHHGHSMLIVAVDDFDKRHNSLQLDLDKFVREDGNKLKLWHNGTLTAGNKGRQKSRDVLKYVSKKAPWLIKGGEVFLGELPAHRYARWADAKDFLDRLIAYALIRDEFRRS